MFKFTGITKTTFSREGSALEGQVTTIKVAGPAEVLVVSMGATQDEIAEIAARIVACVDACEGIPTSALEQQCDKLIAAIDAMRRSRWTCRIPEYLR